MVKCIEIESILAVIQEEDLYRVFVRIKACLSSILNPKGCVGGQHGQYNINIQFYSLSYSQFKLNYPIYKTLNPSNPGHLASQCTTYLQYKVLVNNRCKCPFVARLLPNGFVFDAHFATFAMLFYSSSEPSAIKKILGFWSSR